MDVLLAQLLLLVMVAAPLGAILAPPIVMIVRRRAPMVAGLLYLAALVGVVAWLSAANAHMARPGRPGHDGIRSGRIRSAGPEPLARTGASEHSRRP